MARQTVTKGKLSGSTNGKPIVITNTSSPGTLIHTATNAANTVDWITLYVYNGDASERTLVLEWGGTTSAEELRETIGSKAGVQLEMPALPLDGGLIVRAWCSSASALKVLGFVERVVDE